MVCPGCGEEHEVGTHEADPNDPRIGPWMDLLAASGAHSGSDHLLIIQLPRGDERRTELLVTGMDNAIQQVNVLGRMIFTIMVDSGAAQDAKLIRATIETWLETMERIQHEIDAAMN